MFAKIAILACVLAVANAGVIARNAYDAAPVVASYATPAVASYAAPAYANYAAPAYTSYADPAPVAVAGHVAHAAPIAYSAPVAHAAPAVAHGSSLLGVAYSPAAAVSHMTYSSPIIGYGW